MKKLGIIVSHPIQYYAPLFRHLSKQIDLVVFYCHNPNESEIGTDGFGLKFKWDIDLLSGYKHVFLKNISKKPSLSSFNGCNTPDIGKQLKKENITHVLIFGWYLRSHWQTFFYCLKNKIPVASRGDSQLNPHESKLKSFSKKIIYPLFIKKYNALLYVGKRNKEYLIEYGAVRDQLIFSPHAVDQEFWEKENNNKIKREKKRFVWVGKFIDKKRPTDVVKAFIIANEIKSDLELWMIGTGPLHEETRKLAVNNANISFHGFKNQTELRGIYHKCDCLILASDRSETWGLVVNEAFACGIPAIVSDDCGCSDDLIEQGSSGFLFRSGNYQELAETMIKTSKLLENVNYFSSGIDKKNKVYSYENSCAGIMEFITKKNT